jgi:hypothetical protein
VSVQSASAIYDEKVGGRLGSVVNLFMFRTRKHLYQEPGEGFIGMAIKVELYATLIFRKFRCTN